MSDSFGLPYQQAYKRRLALSEDEEQKIGQRKKRLSPLDKSS
jgi:hypothetical protein